MFKIIIFSVCSGEPVKKNLIKNEPVSTKATKSNQLANF